MQLQRAPTWAIFLRALRDYYANVSNEHFAKKLELAPETLSAVMQGRVKPRQTTINKIKLYIRRELPHEVDDLFALMPEKTTSDVKKSTK